MVMSLCPRFLAHPVGAAVKVHSMCITAAIVRMRNSTVCGVVRTWVLSSDVLTTRLLRPADRIPIPVLTGPDEG